MRQVQLPLAGLPITLVLLSNGCVVLVPMIAFSGILETDPALEVRAWFFPDFFSLTDNEAGEDYDYRVPYLLSEYPVLKRWLIQQQLLESEIVRPFGMNL